MRTAKILLLLLLCFACISSGLPDSNLLKDPKAAKVIALATAQLGVRELTGNNDGKAIEGYLAYVYLKKGNPWCAAFVSWVFNQAGYKKPRSAWSPDLFPGTHRIRDPVAAAVFGIYFPALKRIAHVGLVAGTQHDMLITIEGNTNLAGSREGDGVYKKLRHKRFIAAYANWIK